MDNGGVSRGRSAVAVVGCWHFNCTFNVNISHTKTCILYYGNDDKICVWCFANLASWLAVGVNNILPCYAPLCPYLQSFGKYWIIFNLPFFFFYVLLRPISFFFFLMIFYLNLVFIYNCTFFNMICLCLCAGFSVKNVRSMRRRSEILVQRSGWLIPQVQVCYLCRSPQLPFYIWPLEKWGGQKCGVNLALTSLWYHYHDI